MKLIILFVVLVHAILPCLVQADPKNHPEINIHETINNSYNTYQSVYYGTRGAAGSAALSGVSSGRFNTELFTFGAAVSAVGSSQAVAVGLAIPLNYSAIVGFKFSRERSNITPSRREDLDTFVGDFNMNF